MKNILLVLAMMLLVGNVASAEKILAEEIENQKVYIESDSVKPMQVGQLDLIKALEIIETDGKVTSKTVTYVDKDTKAYAIGYWEQVRNDGTKKITRTDIERAEFYEYKNYKSIDKILEIAKQKEGK